MLEISHLSYSIDKTCILKDISLTVPKGKIVTIVGPNGCGKSTLLKNIARILRPDSGQILLNGQDLRSMDTKELARKMAILPQCKSVAVDLSVEQLVQYGRFPYTGFGGRLSRQDYDMVNNALHAAGIEALRKRAIGTLSGGENQMAWIAMCLAQAPELILLDEPTTYLDICYQLQVLELVQRLNKEMGMTIVMVLHDINQAARYSDLIYMMHDGQVYTAGQPRDVFAPQAFSTVFRVQMRTLDDGETTYYIPHHTIQEGVSPS